MAEEKKIEITESELRERIESAMREGAMPDEEKKIRGMIREEVGGVVKGLLESMFVSDDEQTDNEPGDEGVATMFGLGKKSRAS